MRALAQLAAMRTLGVLATVSAGLGGAEREALRRALACAAGKRHGSQVHVVEFDAATSLANVTVRAPRGPSYGNLRSPLNFARFYLAALLPEAPKVVYLDADAVAARDVADLYDSALADDARRGVWSLFLRQVR